MRAPAVVLALLVVATEISAQQKLVLTALTVPDAKLPADCRLRPPTPPRSAPIWGFFPPNPWSGTERRLVIAVRNRMDGAPRVGDAPPPSPSEAAAVSVEWVRNVVEAYGAVYDGPDDQSVEVWALRFDNVKNVPPPRLGHLLPPARGERERIVAGPVVAQVSAQSNHDCFAAIRRHVGAVKW